MSDASAAGRALSRARWGDQHLRGLVSELERRRDELAGEQLDRLRVLVAEQGRESA